ncbi:CHASE2 domain-containing protein [Treponema sp.]|uniref:CHASE2 domain-containing protein n=1 Tax=Treponema sp. TaxID=166 RepID=UPI00298DB18F|nr:CHASE2 domain-containing protein [Treponema sp.]MCQ2241583.1 CHASE2 domain-containing protein [Treponema sp.]
MKTIKTYLKKHINIIILIFISIICITITKINLFTKIDFRLYDFMLGMQKETKTDEDIVIIDIDNDSIAKVGSWPWTRDILGNVLIRMKEFGSKQAVFDIEYVSPSTKAVEENLEQKINENFAFGQQAITENITDFGFNVSKGKISQANAYSESENLAADISNNILYEMMRNITADFNKDNDDYFARAVQFFGNASLTVNIRDIAIQTEESELKYIEDRFLFKNVSDPYGLILKGNKASEKEEGDETMPGFVPVIHKIAARSNGVGFTNVVVDKDGTRRRVQLMAERNGMYAGQLSFAPLVKLLDIQSIERTKNAYILKGLKEPGKENRIDIKIPVDKYGRMLINWLHRSYEESFAHVPAYLLYNLDLAEERVIECISKASKEDLSFLTAEDQEYILGNCQYAAEEYAGMANQKTRMLLKCRGFDNENNPIRGGLTEDDYSEYFGRRAEFFENMMAFVNEFDSIPGCNQNASLAELKDSMVRFINDFNYLKEIFKDAFVLLGNSASSSTDLGVTPFAKSYANLGTHANVANTIIQQDFITEKSPFMGLILGFISALAVIILTRKKSHGRKNIFGLIYVFIPVLILFILMVGFKIYIPLINTAVLVFLIYTFETIVNFRLINNEKKFITNAFSQCLSKDVVNDIVNDPSSLKLGGDSREMTAIFTDIQKFSGFSEVLNAAELVALLNYYLTPMSNKIMDEGGMVDKYEGDAIVALVGAPVKFEDHASRACIAAIKMKKYEKEMNSIIREYAAKDEAPELTPDLFSAFKKMVANHRGIFTRIGINSGEMVAGFMGSELKKNYTMMGNNVNLASRLEGVNKQYCTGGILISEATRLQLDDSIIVRSLDRVQVVNVKTPMRLYEVLDFKSEVPEDFISYIEEWEEGMKAFETADYKKALDIFKNCAAKAENYEVFDRNADKKDGEKIKDKVAEYYITLIEKFFLAGTYPKPEDDFGVAYNNENPGDMDPSWVGTKYEIKGTFTLLQK